ncbi:hypothetical protein CAI21_18315 [Alkalilimnicola ehrlichii]|uniref:Ketoreductase domain-containing protein n=1 Tax=Alkalilimnicola ehrlichii TaxID=351052 RepID=A0A3E0WQI8_9GAMM|nr:SDR family oxidoreductase [Alkalilimnicola ehrlichii]RFA25810.1 hypothetical protein CAI21_18315 [Alkalilimnicola ehrlichii]RFA35088.1 hypothetical protein CAL65_13325 [Alkalilimnicola ehrlichii]
MKSKPILKPLHEQTVVITGASSGIGLVTARRLAQHGAKVVLAARNETALKDLTEELQHKGCQAIYVVTDVGNEKDVQQLAKTAIKHFGGFDTWINNAAVSIYGKVEQVSIEDQRRLWDTNYWGVVYGSRIACEHLRVHGGKLINIGSALSERAIPIQGIYSASKAAVMGITDALRMELEQERAPISVTLIKPGAIDTPYKEHAANYLDTEGQNPPPVYAPDTVADAILHACTTDVRDVVVGAGGKALTTLGNVAPRLMDLTMSRLMPYLQRTNKPSLGVSKGSLYEPQQDGQERSDYPFVLERSLYTDLVHHKAATAAMTVLTTAALIYGTGKALENRTRRLSKRLPLPTRSRQP